MTLIIPPNYHNVRFEWTSPNFFKGRALTQIGCIAPSLDRGEIAVAFATSWGANLRELLATSVTLESIVVESATEASVVLVNEDGEHGGTPGDPQISLLVKKVVSERGPRAKGRSYWPGMVYESTYDQTGVMSSGDQDAYQAQFTDFYEDLSTAGVQMVILQNEEGDSPPLDPPPEILALLVDIKSGTQRRRNRS